MHAEFYTEYLRRLEGRKHRWEDNIKIDLEEIGCEAVIWIGVAHDVIQ
jgi:hypothetical protein